MRLLTLLPVLLLALPARAEEPEGEDPLAAVRAAFAEGQKIPDPPRDALDEEPQLAGVVKRVKDVAAGCAPPCVAPEEVARYKKALRLVDKILKLPDAAAVEKVYCPGEPPACRLRGGGYAKVRKLGAAPGVVAKGLSDERAAQIAQRGQRLAAALDARKGDDLTAAPVGDGGPAAQAAAPMGTETAATKPAAPKETAATPAPPSAAPRPAADAGATAAPAGGLLGRVTHAFEGYVDQSRAEFTAERDASTLEVGGAALAALAALPGGKAKDLAARLTAARELADPKRGETLRALVSEADAALTKLLGEAVKRAAAERRAAGCAQKRGAAARKCLEAEPSAQELDAAREQVFQAAPDLGLYFVARSRHQLLVKGRLADGALWAGLTLQPWELGAEEPAGTQVVVGARAAEDDGRGYLGLTFNLPDGSTRFEGARPAKDGVERLIDVAGQGGERVRSVTVADARDASKTLRAQTDYFNPDGRLVRSETVSASGARVELKDFNVAGAEKEPRRYEIREKKAGGWRVEVRDPDHLTNTIVEPDGRVTIEARVAGLPRDPKLMDSQRWKRKEGALVGGKLETRKIEMQDGTVYAGATKDGRFSATSAVDASGAGWRKAGRVLVTLRANRAEKYSLDLTREKATRDNCLGLAAEFAAAAGLEPREARAGALGEWLYDTFAGGGLNPDAEASIDRAAVRAACGPEIKQLCAAAPAPAVLSCLRQHGPALSRGCQEGYAKARDFSDGAGGAMLVSDKPSSEVYFMTTVPLHEKEGETGALEQAATTDVAGTTVGRWESGAKFLGKDQGRVLQSLDNQGVPKREYVKRDVMRQWFKAYSNDGGSGLFHGGKEYEHAFLVEFHRDPKRDRSWSSDCADEISTVVYDPEKPCAARDEVGKPTVVQETRSGLGELASALGDVPVLKQAGEYGAKGYYTAIGYLQEDVGHIQGSLGLEGGADMRLAVIANKFRGAASTQDTLEALALDPELRRGVDEKVVEKRKERYADQCKRLGDNCDQWARSLGCGARQKPPCVSADERLEIVRTAYSPSHAVDYAAAGGSKFLYVLGGLGQAGEMAASSLPAMGLTEGLGAAGKLKWVGGAARFADAALGGYMTAGWAVGGLSNAGEMAQAIKEKDYGKLVKTGVQGVTDGYFGYKLAKELGKGARRSEDARRDLAAEKQRLEKAKLVDPGTLADTGLHSVQLDLGKAPAEELKLYKDAMKEVGIEEPPVEHGMVEFMTSPRRRALLEARLKGTKIESIDMAEHASRWSDRKPFTDDEVDAMFAANAVSHEPASAEPVGAGESGAAHAVQDAEARGRAIERIWDARNGAALTAPETVKAQRAEAFANAANKKLARAVKAAEKSGDIAEASWQGRQGAENNCVPHALANASKGVFTLKETVRAGVEAGADYSKAGTNEEQLMQMLLSLEEVGAKKGYQIDFTLIPIEDYFRVQDERARQGLPREPALLGIRTGGGRSDPHGLHAVVLRGHVVVDGQPYIVVTDSHLNKPLLYTPEAFSAAAVANGVLVIKAERAAQPVRRAGRGLDLAVVDGEAAGAGTGSGAKGPDEAAPAPEGDGGHGEHGSVEERRRAKQLDIFVVDPSGRVTFRPDGVVDLPSKPGYALVQRNKRTGDFELVQGDQRALAKAKAFAERMDKARR